MTLRGNRPADARVVITTAPGEEGQVDYGEGPMVRDRGTGKYRRTRLFVLTLGGFMFSGYLTSMEAFVLHSWCLWCVGSAITMTLLFIVSSARLWRSFNAEGAEEEE